MAGGGRGLLSLVAQTNPLVGEDEGAAYDSAKTESGRIPADTRAAPARQGSGTGSGDNGADGELGSVILWGEDGTETRLLLHPNGWLDPYPGVRVEIGWEGIYPDVTYVITRSNQTVYRFDREGRLQQRTDPQGHVISYTYNITGQISTVTDMRIENNTIIEDIDRDEWGWSLFWFYGQPLGEVSLRNNIIWARDYHYIVAADYYGWDVPHEHNL